MFGNHIRYDFDDVNDDFDGKNGNDCSDNDDPPPPYSESEHDEDTYGENVTLTPLSYINGRYAITCPYVAENYPLYGSAYVLVFAISGSSLWASFDLGVVQGVMYFPDSPRQSSYDPVPFKWRGREAEGPIMYGDQNQGWIKFLGDGRIEGQLQYHKISFRGRRRPGPATVNAVTMQNRWNGYSEEGYERKSCSLVLIKLAAVHAVVDCREGSASEGKMVRF
ncbi:unnamed protein product [Clonostachys rosea f. rosea IK726]|nr:unnamed protein product [Clonostachys rosea f. rosea IK726]